MLGHVSHIWSSWSYCCEYLDGQVLSRDAKSTGGDHSRRSREW